MIIGDNRIGDLNRDLRVIWEKDYPHLMYRRKDTPRNYFGYKGGEFEMTVDVEVYIAYYGCCGERITNIGIII